MRIVFMGSPPLAVPCLEAAARAGDLVGVVTQPPRPAGRGLAATPSAVAVRARAMGLVPMDPSSVRTEGFRGDLTALAPDLAVVVAYGRILPPEVLAVPRLGCVNVHLSLLPELRGAAPVQWAIARGLSTTGVTLMQMDEGMDTGPILLQRETAVGEAETAPHLAQRLSLLGAEVLAEGLPALERGMLRPRPQDVSRATYAPLLRKEDGVVDWTRDAREIAARLRAFQPWPGASTTVAGEAVALTAAEALPAGGPSAPGVVTAVSREGIDVACGGGTLRILRLRPAGRREMSAAEYLAGRRLSSGERLGGGAR